MSASKAWAQHPRRGTAIPSGNAAAWRGFSPAAEAPALDSAPWMGARRMGSEGAGQGHEAALTAILAQVSREALQGDGLDEVLQHICDCLVRNLPVAIASIILLDERGTTFVKEVWAGEEHTSELQSRENL